MNEFRNRANLWILFFLTAGMFCQFSLWSQVKQTTANPIDFYFDKEVGKRKLHFPQVDDLTFMRRVWLDLAGTLPPAGEEPLAGGSPLDRGALIEQVLASEAYNHRWTHFLEEMFNNRRFRNNGTSRNYQHETLAGFIEENRSWDEIARYMITYQGPVDREGSTYALWQEASGFPQVRQDGLDDEAAFITDKFLGIQTNCISCHDGAYHLEDVNVGLSVMKRQQFWGLAAFFASSSLYCRSGNCYANNQIDWANLSYVSHDDPDSSPVGGFNFLFFNQPFNGGQYIADTQTGMGMRPPRQGGTIQPKYPFSGEGPQLHESRRGALARILTEDRQFARNMVNRIWGQLMGEPFVSPVNGFDLARLNGEVAAAHETTVQPRDAELMEWMTDLFIGGGFDMKHLIRTIADSQLYQLDYAQLPEHEGSGIGPYWGGVARVRRLEAEAIVESIKTVAEHRPRYLVRGYRDRTFENMWSMPDTDEPGFIPNGDLNSELFGQLGLYTAVDVDRHQDRMFDMLRDLGRGDRDANLSRDKQMTHSAALALLNSDWLLTEILDKSPVARELSDQLEAGETGPDQIVETLYLKALYRYPTNDEATMAKAHLAEVDPHQGVKNLIWWLFNHPDFLYR